MSKTKEGIIDILAQHQEDLERLQVKSLALFGSVARGEQRPDSDIDFWVEFENGSSFDKYYNLTVYLENTLQQDIDLLTFQSLRPRMMKHIHDETIYVT